MLLFPQVPQKFRYPFFTEMLWYVLDRYVGSLLGRTHLIIEGQSPPPPPPDDHVHLTQNELHGLKVPRFYELNESRGTQRHYYYD